jgi:aldose 1-epimerase
MQVQELVDFFQREAQFLIALQKRGQMFSRRIGSKRMFFVTMVLWAMSLAAKTHVTKTMFGKMPDGTPVDMYTLDSHKIQIRIMTYGGIVVSLRTPDRSGKFDDIVLGFDSFDEYLAKNTFFGALVGRYANRIANGKFALDGVTYTLPINDGRNTLHGGKGFDKVVWQAKAVKNGVELTHVSKDGDQGFPGNLTATVRYTLIEHDLIIDYRATTDKSTVVNLTNHSYFNLAGHGNGDILKHIVQINASHYTPANPALIPTGEIASVEGTPFDFRSPHEIAKRINEDNEQLRVAKGYDQNWVLNSQDGKIAEAAKVYEPTTGRTLDVLTTEPGLQFYTANHMEGTTTGKQGKLYGFRTALCLETEHFPDSPNHPNFPSTELKPGQQYHSVTIFRFATRPN